MPIQPDMRDVPAPSITDPKTEAIISAILMLVNGLSEVEKASVLRQLIDKLRPVALPRAGDVLSAVIDLLPKERSWTVREVKERVEAQDAKISDKEIYNAIGYLARKQHIERLGYGRYRIAGIVVHSTDDLGGQPSITESDLDD